MPKALEAQAQLQMSSMSQPIKRCLHSVPFNLVDVLDACIAVAGMSRLPQEVKGLL